MTSEQITAEYVKQIITAAKEEDEYLVTHLLREFGSKVYHEGRKDWIEMLAKREGWEVNRKEKA